MSWHPNDLLTDADLQAYEASVLTQFGRGNWQTLRTKAIEDWLFPILRGRGFNPQLFRTRYEPDQVFGFTAAVYTDLTGAARDASTEDINLATVFATFGTDALYIGSKSPFMGLFFRLHDAVSSVAAVLAVAYWNGNWEPLTVTDATSQVAGKAFSAGGAVTWTLPVDWAPRAINSVGKLYWTKVTIGATPTGAVASQIGTIRASLLRAPLTYRTLQLLFTEAPTSGEGPWSDKAQFYREECDAALQRALPLIAGEFDTDESDLISNEESAQTDDDAGGEGFLMERR
jgi:hypothetical protein